MANKTAVEWLASELLKDGFIIPIGYYFKAKAMEKEQIIDAYEYGYWRGNNEDECEPEQYYENPYCDPNNKKYENNN